MASPQTGLLTNFNAANSTTSAGAGFTNIANNLGISSNQCYGVNGAAFNVAYWNTIMSSNDCECWITQVTKPANNIAWGMYIGLKDVGSLATIDGYIAAFTTLSGTDTVIIQRIDNGVATTLGATINYETSNGDKLLFRRIGNDLYVYHFSAANTFWQLVGQRTDSTYTAAGYLGLIIQNNTARLDDFGGGAYVPSRSIVRQPTKSRLGNTAPLTGGLWLQPMRVPSQSKIRRSGLILPSLTPMVTPLLGLRA